MSQLEHYFATEAGARATRLTLVGDIANAWLTYAADTSLLLIAAADRGSAEKSVELTRLRLEGGIAPRTDLSQAEQILTQAQADLAQQRTAVAQDVNALQLLVGAPIDPSLLPASIDEAGSTIAELPAGLNSDILLRRPDVRPGRISAARRQCRDRRRARRAVPAHHAHRPARLCQHRAHQPVHRRRVRLVAPGPTPPTRSSRPAPATPTSA